MGILDQFGIEGKLLIVQLINFAILTFVMIRYIFPRASKMLEERKSSIESALKQADEARTEAERARVEHDASQKKAKAQAATILKEARQMAQTQSDTIVADARAESKKILEQAEARIKAEKEKLRTELRAEVADLTIETARKVLSRVVSPADTTRMVEAASAELSKRTREARRG